METFDAETTLPLPLAVAEMIDDTGSVVTTLLLPLIIADGATTLDDVVRTGVLVVMGMTSFVVLVVLTGVVGATAIDDCGIRVGNCYYLYHVLIISGCFDYSRIYLDPLQSIPIIVSP